MRTAGKASYLFAALSPNKDRPGLLCLVEGKRFAAARRVQTQARGCVIQAENDTSWMPAACVAPSPNLPSCIYDALVITVVFG